MSLRDLEGFLGDFESFLPRILDFFCGLFVGLGILGAVIGFVIFQAVFEATFCVSGKASLRAIKTTKNLKDFAICLESVFLRFSSY